jgi:hypothetical protein
VLNALGPVLGIGRRDNGPAAFETPGARKSRTGRGRWKASCRNIRAAGAVWEDCKQLREIVRAAIILEQLEKKNWPVS